MTVRRDRLRKAKKAEAEAAGFSSYAEYVAAYEEFLAMLKP